MINEKQHISRLISFLLVCVLLLPNIAGAVPVTEPEQEFVPYAYASPAKFDPIWNETTTLYWNYEKDHPDNTVDIRKNGRVIGIIRDGARFYAGDNSFEWNGKATMSGSGQLENVEPGYYTIVVTPNDEYSIYAKQFYIQIYENIKMEVTGVPDSIGHNEDGWYSPNNVPIKARYTNQTDKTLTVYLDFFIGDATKRVRMNNENEFEKIETGFFKQRRVTLGPGQTIEWESEVWFQPENRRDVKFNASFRTSDFHGGNVISHTVSEIASLPSANINPVVFIPGFSGSWLNADGEWEIDPLLDSYSTIMYHLEYLGYERDVTLFAYPYDWRNRIQDIASGLADRTKSILSGAEFQYNYNDKTYIDSSDVDLIAHSMGGLISRSYIQGSEYNYNVDQLITVGTPHQGSPEAYLKTQGIEVDYATKLVFKNLASKSGYHTRYYDWYNGYRYTVTDKDLYNYINDKVPSALQLMPWSGYKYLIDKKTGQYKTQPANPFLDDLNSSAGLQKLEARTRKVVAIVGNPDNTTLTEIKVSPQKASDKPLWAYGRLDSDNDLVYGEGDFTVPRKSADLSKLLNSADARFYKTSPKDNSVIVHQQMMIQLQRETAKHLTGYTHEKYYENSPPWFGKKAWIAFTRLSPVQFMVIDPQGRRVGFDPESGQVVNEVPGARFTYHPLINEPEFLLLPELNEGQYTVKVSPIGQGGQYGIVVQGFLGDDVWAIDKLEGAIGVGEQNQHNVNVRLDEIHLQGIDVEWLLPGKKDEEGTTVINSIQTLPIKFSIRDKASNAFINHLLQDIYVIVNKKDEEPFVTFFAGGKTGPDETVTDSVYSNATVTEDVYNSTGDDDKYGQSDHIRIDLVKEHYIVNLHTKSFERSPGIYEIRIGHKGSQIGRTEYFVIE